MKKVFLVLLAVMVLLGIAGGLAWREFQRFLEAPLDLPPGGYVYHLESGTPGQSIVRQLAAQGLTRPGWQWKLLMRMEPALYRAGEYLSLIHISEPTRLVHSSRMPSSA